MKRVLILTPTHSLRGGVESILADVAHYLPERSWRVVLGLARGTRFNDPCRFAALHGLADWVEIDGNGGTHESRTQSIIRVVRAIRPDILFSARVFEAFEACRRLKKQGLEVRFGLTVQAYEDDYFLDLQRWSSMVDLCVTSGRLVRAACVDVCGLSPDRCVSIPGGVRSGKPRFRGGPNTLRIGYAGRLYKSQKRIWDLVHISEILIAKGVRFQLRIAGTGPEEEPLAARFSNLLGPDFAFMGWIADDSKLREFYRNLDVFLHTAGHEGVTIAPREAMAEGVVPVISEFVGFWTEGHFRPGANCLAFPPGDTAAAARAIAQIDADRGLMAGLSRAASASQSGVYSWDGALDAWATAFDRCLEMPVQPALSRPPTANPDSGRLARLGLPPGLAQKLRDVFGRAPVHASGGDEWPHAGPPPDSEFAGRLEKFARESEARARG